MVCKKALSSSFYFVIKFLWTQFLAFIENVTYVWTSMRLSCCKTLTGPLQVCKFLLVSFCKPLFTWTISTRGWFYWLKYFIRLRACFSTIKFMMTTSSYKPSDLKGFLIKCAKRWHSLESWKLNEDKSMVVWKVPFTMVLSKWHLGNVDSDLACYIFLCAFTVSLNGSLLLSSKNNLVQGKSNHEMSQVVFGN